MSAPTMDRQQYENYQKVVFRSFESQSEIWRSGQRRFIQSWLLPYKDSKILDCACGDGVGLEYFKELGFTNVTGLEFEESKAQLASRYYPVLTQDFHSVLPDNYDLIYSSHSLEHALDPATVIKNFRAHCKELIVVIPYPDPRSLEAHCAKQIMGSDLDDDGVTVVNYISSFGFSLQEKKFDNFREEEIWMKFN